MLIEKISRALAPNSLQRYVLRSKASASHPVPPYELDEIMLMFGDIFRYIHNDGTIQPKWEDDQMSSVELPFAIPLSSCPAIKINKIYCHKKLNSTFADVFTALHERKLEPYIHSYGGCYGYRLQHRRAKLSAHSWGIAIDLNPETNLPGSNGDMHPEIVEVFESFGFEWGGHWRGKEKNPMHFQWCTGY